MLCFVETRVPQPWSLRPPLQCPRTKVPESRTEDKEEKNPGTGPGQFEGGSDSSELD